MSRYEKGGEKDRLMAMSVYEVEMKGKRKKEVGVWFVSVRFSLWRREWSDKPD
jgi:hypothetical protein